MGVKNPFKAVPIRPKRLTGLEEFDKPLWSPFRNREPINWLYALVGLLIGACVALAYLLWFE